MVDQKNGKKKKKSKAKKHPKDKNIKG